MEIVFPFKEYIIESKNIGEFSTEISNELCEGGYIYNKDHGQIFYVSSVAAEGIKGEFIERYILSSCIEVFYDSSSRNLPINETNHIINNSFILNQIYNSEEKQILTVGKGTISTIKEGQFSGCMDIAMYKWGEEVYWQNLGEKLLMDSFLIGRNLKNYTYKFGYINGTNSYLGKFASVGLSSAVMKEGYDFWQKLTPKE